MDTLPELITKKDLAAREFIRQINEMYQGVIRELVETKLARDSAVLTQENVSQTIREVKKNENGDNVVVSRTYQFVYDNFFYGDKSSGFSAAPSCSLTRGSEFRPGESSIVEANRGHSVTAPALDNEMLARDAEDGIVCPSDPDDLTRSYW